MKSNLIWPFTKKERRNENKEEKTKTFMCLSRLYRIILNIKSTLRKREYSYWTFTCFKFDMKNDKKK